MIAHIDRNIFDPYIVEIQELEWKAVSNGDRFDVDRNDFSFTNAEGQKKQFCYAFIIIHGTPGENGLLEGYLRLMHIPFSTCDVLPSALTFNKYMLNKLLKSFGINVSESIRIRRGIDEIDPDRIVETIGLPCFIKPTDGGSSFGTTKVSEKGQIAHALEEAFKENPDIMIESFMKGLEVTNGYFKTKKGEVRLPVTEVVPKTEFFDYDAKYNGMVEEITPARIPNELRDRIQSQTARIYDILDCHGIIRNDYIITADGKINLLEVNTTPGMTATSFIPQQVRAAGLDLTQVLTDLIEDSFN